MNGTYRKAQIFWLSFCKIMLQYGQLGFAFVELSLKPEDIPNPQKFMLIFQFNASLKLC